MLRRWIAYLLALLGALVLRVAYTGWLAGVVLWWGCSPPCPPFSPARFW